MLAKVNYHTIDKTHVVSAALAPVEPTEAASASARSSFRSSAARSSSVNDLDDSTKLLVAQGPYGTPMQNRLPTTTLRNSGVGGGLDDSGTTSCGFGLCFYSPTSFNGLQYYH